MYNIYMNNKNIINSFIGYINLVFLQHNEEYYYCATLKEEVGWFYDISTFVGYLMPNPFLFI